MSACKSCELLVQIASITDLNDVDNFPELEESDFKHMSENHVAILCAHLRTGLRLAKREIEELDQFNMDLEIKNEILIAEIEKSNRTASRNNRRLIKLQKKLEKMKKKNSILEKRAQEARMGASAKISSEPALGETPAQDLPFAHPSL